MSPLMIILLMLILAIGSAHQTTWHSHAAGEERSQSFPRTNNRSSSPPDGVNYVTINVGRNQRDPSTTRRIRLRQDLQQLLSTMVKKIIQQRRLKQPKRADVLVKENKRNGKTVESNKIPIGEFPEDNGVERGVEAGRDDADYKSLIARSSNDLGEIRERLSEDLFRVSEALLPTIRRIARSGLRQVRDHVDEPTKPRINQGNSSGAGQSSRVKREATKEVREETSEGAVWMKKDFTDHQTNLKMHAFVVKDEEIPPCCSPAKQVTNRRYLMCSGAVLTLKHAITSASCIHYADIYERNVQADLAVLVGATEPRAYVIKINRYEMHPDYDYDVDSKNHATNNLAVLYLACSIVAQDIIVPSLPKGLNDDVAHMCCRESCDLITIMESSDNRHTAHIVQAKHLPAPRHDDEDAQSYRDLSNNALEALQVINKPIFSNESFAPSRRIRSPLKLAAAPTFFGKESRRYSRLQSSVKSPESPNPKKRKKAKSAQTSSAKNQRRDGKRKKPLNFDDFINRARPGRAHIPIMRALEQQGVNVEEQLAAIDWQKVEETVAKKFPANNREKMENFAKNVVDETMRRLENVLSDDDGEYGGEDSMRKGNGSSVFEKLMPNNSRNKTIENFVHVFTKVVSSLVPPNNAGSSFATSLDTSLEEKDLKDPPPSNQECPPLGSPVFANGTLVGLVAYTCDDVQSWVEWRYVNIAKNLNWIRKQMRATHGLVGMCAGPEQPVQSLRNAIDDQRGTTGEEMLPRLNETEIRSGKVEWRRREAVGDVLRSGSTGNVDGARYHATYPRIPKDAWFARNPPLTPQAQQAVSRNQPQLPSRNDPPIYSFNTCYVKPDGSTDCRTRGDFDIR